MLTAATPNRHCCQRLRVRGLVQGVGFRPTVYRLAHEMKLTGEVLNDGDGVQIILSAAPDDIDTFIQHLQQHCPPLARIDSIERSTLEQECGYQSFTIRDSEHSRVRTGIVADAATCAECLNDINDPQNRRAGYAFTNCTHCGPRLSIVKNIPYDRAFTSMASFTMCAACQQEYDNPADRRFHAQPNACPDCGPVLALCDQQGTQQPVDDVIGHAARLLQQGHILAIKGIGGFQLACDASNEQAVKTLRQRKRRPHKSLALMAAHVNQVRQYCQVSAAEASTLQSHQAPIVVLARRAHKTDLPDTIAPGQNTLGFMLPYSPLHHLLMQALTDPIVLTSGNRSEEPQCIDNTQAIARLADIADYFVLHDRDIVNRIDDSVLRFVDQRPMFYRRARGYAPTPLALPDGFDSGLSLLALGGEMKNTFCLQQHGQAVLSQHMGNLENALTFEDTLDNLALYQRLFEFQADAIVIDQHPDYLSSKHGQRLAATAELPLIPVQHHHAHIASCLVDNGWSPTQGAVIGVALDGLGFGDDGTIWGGEFLLADYHDYTRLARFKPAPMPGATRAIVEPWRNTYAQLHAHCDWLDLNHRYASLNLFQYLNQQSLGVIEQMITRNINSPLTSSCGRLFDAVAAALGLSREHISFEGQAAMALEALVEDADMRTLTPYPFELEQRTLLEINPQPMWLALLHDLHEGKPLAHIAARFHLCMVQIIRTTVARVSQQTSLNTVALSGGVFQNMTLLRHSLDALRQDGFDVLTHRQVPSNDGGLALGQAAIANATLTRGNL